MLPAGQGLCGQPGPARSSGDVAPDERLSNGRVAGPSSTSPPGVNLRSVQRAVPAALGVVPLQDPAEVGADTDNGEVAVLGGPPGRDHTVARPPLPSGGLGGAVLRAARTRPPASAKPTPALALSSSAAPEGRVIRRPMVFAHEGRSPRICPRSPAQQRRRCSSPTSRTRSPHECGHRPSAGHRGTGCRRASGSPEPTTGESNRSGEVLRSPRAERVDVFEL